MGYNLYSCCHKCKIKSFHLRNKENQTILPFYIKHLKCANINKSNVETIIDQNGSDPEWMNNPEDGGYEYDEITN